MNKGPDKSSDRILIPRGSISDEDIEELREAVKFSTKVEIYDSLYPRGVWASIRELPRKLWGLIRSVR